MDDGAATTPLETAVATAVGETIALVVCPCPEPLDIPPGVVGIVVLPLR